MATSNPAYQLAAQISTIINNKKRKKEKKKKEKRKKKKEKRKQSIINRVIIWLTSKLLFLKVADKKEGLN